MDSIQYINITEYKTPLELNYYYARNNEPILCSCGKMVIKNNIWRHWNTKKHRRNTDISKDSYIFLPTQEAII